MLVDDPVVTPAAEFAGEPEELAVPVLLVPGAGGVVSLGEFPATPGSLPELFRPPPVAGADGAPPMPVVPVPAEPALGDPAAVPPADDPLAPPALCANEATGPARITIATMDAVTDSLVIWKTPFAGYRLSNTACGRFRTGTISAGDN